jgi:hypothetical protein
MRDDLRVLGEAVAAESRFDPHPGAVAGDADVNSPIVLQERQEAVPVDAFTRFADTAQVRQ